MGIVTAGSGSGVTGDGGVVTAFPGDGISGAGIRGFPGDDGSVANGSAGAGDGEDGIVSVLMLVVMMVLVLVGPIRMVVVIMVDISKRQS